MTARHGGPPPTYSRTCHSWSAECRCGRRIVVSGPNGGIGFNITQALLDFHAKNINAGSRYRIFTAQEDITPT